MPSIPVTTESIQSKINQTQDELVDQNVIDKNDSINFDSVTSSHPMNIESDTQNKTVIPIKVNTTESVGDKLLNSSKPVNNESQILVETSTLLSTTLSSTPCMKGNLLLIYIFNYQLTLGVLRCCVCTF